jgi:hypothetical protein
MAVIMKNAVFLDVKTCSLICLLMFLRNILSQSLG